MDTMRSVWEFWKYAVPPLVDHYKLHYAKSVQIRSFFWSGSISPYSVRMQENTDQKKLRVWTLFTQWSFTSLASIGESFHSGGRKANFVPVYKNNYKQLVKNCCPICLLLICDKIFELILCDTLLNFLNQKNDLYFSSLVWFQVEQLSY